MFKKFSAVKGYLKICFRIFLIGLIAVKADSQENQYLKLNLDHFTDRKYDVTSEVKQLNRGEFLNHPELGLMPFNAPPCKDCIENLGRRTENSRYFVKSNTSGREFYIQQSNSPINYKDENGFWREINEHLERNCNNIFSAVHQPNPVTIDLNTNQITLRNALYEISASAPELIWRETNGIEHMLNYNGLANFSAGDDGIKILNYYDGVDLIISVRQGEFETSFVLNNRLPFSDGNLLLRQKINLPQGLQFVPRKSKSVSYQEILISDKKNVPFFTVEEGYAFDSRSQRSSVLLNSSVNQELNCPEFIIDGNWLTNPDTRYPVYIDPVISTQNTTPVGSIAGTRYSPVCWTNSCDYLMTVPTPANTTIIGIYQYFEYTASGLCAVQDGGYSIDFSGCHAPAGPPGVFTIPSSSPGYMLVDSSEIPEFVPCFPAPQCAPQNLDFTLHFYRCNNDPDTTCSSNCIRATKPWIMVVNGRTLELSSITAPQQVCSGTTAEIVAVPQYGVPPYTFSWTQGAPANDTINVAPASSTTYTVTITDACGLTASDSTVVNVVQDNNPGFTVTPNPACENTNVNIDGNAGGAATDYDWILPGSSAAGGILNDNQNPVVSYSIAGSYDVILVYENNTCGFADTMSVTISSLTPVSIGLSAQPAGSVCQGDTVHFNASPVNGGSAPTYDWLIDGAVVQSGLVDSLVTSSFSNGSLVQVVLHSNSACASSANDTASLFMSIGSALTPLVTITPDTAVCSGDPVTLTATPTNGGTTPSFQWYVNGNPIIGATSSSYSFNLTPPDTVFGVIMTSSLSCITSATTGDTSIVNILQNISPVVTVIANPVGTVCAGDSVHYIAQTTNGGTSPLYQWYINGALNANTDSLLDIIPLNGDSVSVTMTSSLSCVTTPSDDDYTIVTVSPSVSPSVTVTAAPSVTICQGDTIDFTASATNAGSSPVYSWTVNGVASGTNDSLLSLSNLNDNDIVRIVVTSSLSCAPVPSDTDQVTVTVVGNVAPSVTIIPGTAVCEGDTMQLIANASNAGPGAAFQWFVNGGSIGQSGDTVSLNSLLQGDSVTVTLTSGLACVSPSTVTSQPYVSTLQPLVSPQIDITISPSDSICPGQVATIHPTTLNGGTAPVIQWYVNGILSNTTGATLSSSTFAQGDIISAQVISNASCLLQTTDTSNFVRIYYYQGLGVQVQFGPIDCPGMPLTVTATGTGGNGQYHYLWSDGSPDTSVITVLPGRNSNLTLQLIDNCTAQPASTTVGLPVLPNPVAEFFYYNPSPSSFEYTIQFVNQSIDADSWLWTFPDSSTSTDLDPQYVFPHEGEYEIKLFTMNNSGCVDSVIYTITVHEEEAIYSPNSFTPNGDGINDFFTPLGASLRNYELTIWNRWGEMIYAGNNLMLWDGHVRNSKSLAPEGVYVFRLDLLDDSYEKRVITGRVTLIR